MPAALAFPWPGRRLEVDEVDRDGVYFFVDAVLEGLDLLVDVAFAAGHLQVEA
jgi:hypothetical protein